MWCYADMVGAVSAVSAKTGFPTSLPVFRVCADCAHLRPPWRDPWQTFRFIPGRFSPERPSVADSLLCSKEQPPRGWVAEATACKPKTPGPTCVRLRRFHKGGVGC